jgi:hypothetical protein
MAASNKVAVRDERSAAIAELAGLVLSHTPEVGRRERLEVLARSRYFSPESLKHIVCVISFSRLYVFCVTGK